MVFVPAVLSSQVHVPDHRREVPEAGAARSGAALAAPAPRCRESDATECSDAERKPRRLLQVLSHSVLNLHGFEGYELPNTSTVSVRLKALQADRSVCSFSSEYGPGHPR